jgi:hypothetical protein
MCTRALWLVNGGVLPLLVVLMAFIAPPARGATAGELLEKAIYAEETAGDLDGAIKLYEQVIAEAKTANSAAAKAQYRLGLIYEKQGKADLAAAAFRAVVENFADEKELVAQARKRLPSELELLPAPWGDGDELQFAMKMVSGLDIGTMIYRIEPDKAEGKEIWHCTTRGLITVNGGNSLSEVMCDKQSFAPIASLWRHSLLGFAEAIYTDDSVRIKIEGKEDPVVIQITPPVFDNEQGMQLFRRLPLKVGYKTNISIVSSLGGGLVPLGVEVPAMETIETAAGKFECFKLVLNIGQTFWISNDENRYVVRFSATGVTADLAQVSPVSTADVTEVRGDGFSLTLPKGWYSYSPAKEPDAEKSVTYLLDPKAQVFATVAIGAVDSLGEKERVSPQAWTEAGMEELKKAHKDFELAGDGVMDMKIGDLDGKSVIARYRQDGKQKAMWGFAAFDKGKAINLRFVTGKDHFDDKFAKIVQSLKVE